MLVNLGTEMVSEKLGVDGSEPSLDASNLCIRLGETPALRADAVDPVSQKQGNCVHEIRHFGPCFWAPASRTLSGMNSLLELLRQDATDLDELGRRLAQLEARLEPTSAARRVGRGRLLGEPSDNCAPRPTEMT